MENLTLTEQNLKELIKSVSANTTENWNLEDIYKFLQQNSPKNIKPVKLNNEMILLIPTEDKPIKVIYEQNNEPFLYAFKNGEYLRREEEL